MVEKVTHYFTKLERLSSDALLRSAEKLVASENTSIAKLIAHLAEMSSRKTALKLGYRSLFDYCGRSRKDFVRGREVSRASVESLAWGRRGSAKRSLLSRATKAFSRSKVTATRWKERSPICRGS